MFFIGCVVLLIYTFNYSVVTESVFSKTLPNDTRTSFFCNNRYMTIKDNPGALYLFISEGNYRVAIKEGRIYTFSRLNCTDSPPYYTVMPVKNAGMLINDELDEKLTLLRDEIHNAVAGE